MASGLGPTFWENRTIRFVFIVVARIPLLGDRVHTHIEMPSQQLDLIAQMFSRIWICMPISSGFYLFTCLFKTQESLHVNNRLFKWNTFSSSSDFNALFWIFVYIQCIKKVTIDKVCKKSSTVSLTI